MSQSLHIPKVVFVRVKKPDKYKHKGDKKKGLNLVWFTAHF